ncbi:flavin reductase family protein [candidate division WOR-3 bacterium]|nr:flavin reductase family protein [candidate division WOR-3 bacterium]
MMNKLKTVGKFYYYYPQAVAFIGYANNIMPAAWHTPISAQPPLYGVLISPKRHTHTLLHQKKGFTVNFLDQGFARMSADTGSTSGRDIDKLDTFKIGYELGERILGPILNHAYVSYECESYAVHELGDHCLFVGKIVLIHVQKDLCKENDCVDPRKIKPLLYFGKDRYITIDPNTLTIESRQ